MWRAGADGAASYPLSLSILLSLYAATVIASDNARIRATGATIAIGVDIVVAFGVAASAGAIVATDVGATGAIDAIVAATIRGRLLRQLKLRVSL